MEHDGKAQGVVVFLRFSPKTVVRIPFLAPSYVPGMTRCRTHLSQLVSLYKPCAARKMSAANSSGTVLLRDLAKNLPVIPHRDASDRPFPADIMVICRMDMVFKEVEKFV